MIRVLLVEDDEYKQNLVTRTVNEAVGNDNVEIVVAHSAADAARSMEETAFDLAVLDVNLPIRTGEAPRRDGGLRVLRQIVRGGPHILKPSHIIGLTAFADLQDEFSREFIGEAWQLILFDETSDDWATAVRNRAIHIAEVIKAGRPGKNYNFDLGIVTALRNVELEAVLRLPADWKQCVIDGDCTVYYEGAFQRGDTRVRVVAAAAIEMGMAATACLVMKMAAAFRPRFIAMSGITAGLGANFGDVIVADQSWDYGSGKIKTSGKRSVFAPAPNYLDIPAELKERFAFFAAERSAVMSRIKSAWPGNTPDTELQLRIGPMASGAAVVENEGLVKSIQTHNRNVIAVEMETYGAYLAGKVCCYPRPTVFSAKSVCDFGVPPKTDEYQRYAAFTSANFIFEFAIDQLANMPVGAP